MPREKISPVPGPGSILGVPREMAMEVGATFFEDKGGPIVMVQYEEWERVAPWALPKTGPKDVFELSAMAGEAERLRKMSGVGASPPKPDTSPLLFDMSPLPPLPGDGPVFPTTSRLHLLQL